MQNDKKQHQDAAAGSASTPADASAQGGQDTGSAEADKGKASEPASEPGAADDRVGTDPAGEQPDTGVVSTDHAPEAVAPAVPEAAPNRTPL